MDFNRYTNPFLSPKKLYIHSSYLTGILKTMPKYHFFLCCLFKFKADAVLWKETSTHAFWQMMNSWFTVHPTNAKVRVLLIPTRNGCIFMLFFAVFRFFRRRFLIKNRQLLNLFFNLGVEINVSKKIAHFISAQNLRNSFSTLKK